MESDPDIRSSKPIRKVLIANRSPQTLHCDRKSEPRIQSHQHRPGARHPFMYMQEVKTPEQVGVWGLVFGGLEFTVYRLKGFQLRV